MLFKLKLMCYEVRKYDTMNFQLTRAVARVYATVIVISSRGKMYVYIVNITCKFYNQMCIWHKKVTLFDIFNVCL